MKRDQSKRIIGVFVEPEVKEWVFEEAEKRKWSMSLFCKEILREAMEKGLKDGS